jgi:hypothetical protein
MTKVYLSAGELARSFPATVRRDAFEASSTFPATRSLGQSFSVRVSHEVVTIPQRLYNDPTLIHTDSLTALQKELVDCLLTRHSDGFVRERSLVRIVGVNHSWVPPFVIQLAGEYVVEILRVIHQSLPNLDRTVYAEFLCDNSELLELTGQRIVSYWDCYYRNVRREEYVGFKLLDFFETLLRAND